MSTLSELYPHVRRLIPLHLLPQARCEQLCEQLAINEAAPGEVLFHRGEEDPDWIYLLKGEVALEADGILMEQVSGASDAARFPLAHQVPRKLAARALTELRYIRIDHRRLKPMEHYQDEEMQSQPEKEMEETTDWMTKLFKSPIFQRLPASNLQKVLSRLQEVEVSRGEKIIAQGDYGDALYILRAGKCRVTRRPHPNAREIKLAEFRPGDMFGEDALLSGQPRAVDVTMLTDGVVMRLEKDDFLSLVAEPVLEKVSFESAFREVEQGAVWLDVRDSESYRRNHLEGSLNIPFFSLRMQLSGLQRQRRYILVCDRGGVSVAATFLLLRFGFEAAALTGGLTNVPGKCLQEEDRSSNDRMDDSQTATTIAFSPMIEEKGEVGKIVQESSELAADDILEKETQEDVVSRFELEGIRNNDALRERKKEREQEQTPPPASVSDQKLKAEINNLRREKEALETANATLRRRISDLEEVIRQYWEAAQTEDENEVIQALQSELAMVREQADEDVTAMRRQVEASRQECDRLRKEMESAHSAALPSGLVPVNPEKLPLNPPPPSIRHASGHWFSQALWLVVGVLISLAGLGIGLQTESGRHWLQGWVQVDSAAASEPPARSESAKSEAPAEVEDSNLFADDAGQTTPEYGAPVQSLGEEEGAAMETEDLFAQ
ncbi:MAG: cyclic nucleotide-binding domain-containing protein [Methylothermaceae bacterium]|nr:cyclic nucleotide-binding domain-containing protein [Methylothermaceae bacterium]